MAGGQAFVCVCVCERYTLQAKNQRDTYYNNNTGLSQCLYIKGIKIDLHNSLTNVKPTDSIQELEPCNSLNTHVHTHQTRLRGKAEWFIHEEVLGEIGCALLPYKGGFIE